jgi:pheromone shutdown protein TraB
MLLANTTLSALLGTMLAILTVLAGMAGIGTCAGCCENVERKLTDEKNRQQDL